MGRCLPPVLSPSASGGTVRELQDRIHQMQATKLDTRRRPHPSVARRPPAGRVPQAGRELLGRAVADPAHVLLAGPSAAGSWCAIVGIPEFGIEAAAARNRPRPAGAGAASRRTLAHGRAALADVLSVVAARPPKHASAAAAARLAARHQPARHDPARAGRVGRRARRRSASPRADGAASATATATSPPGRPR